MFRFWKARKIANGTGFRQHHCTTYPSFSFKTVSYTEEILLVTVDKSEVASSSPETDWWPSVHVPDVSDMIRVSSSVAVQRPRLWHKSRVNTVTPADGSEHTPHSAMRPAENHLPKALAPCSLMHLWRVWWRKKVLPANRGKAYHMTRAEGRLALL